VSALLAVGPAAAQNVEVAPFAGVQFGGSFRGPTGASTALGVSLDYGVTFGVRVAEGWRGEVLYLRQPTRLERPGTDLDVTVERYMAGVGEERGDGPTRFFGVALAGASRYVPGVSGYGTETRFTAAVGLGVRHLFTGRLGVRAEARLFYAFTEAGGTAFCRGDCLFTFTGSGLWQADLSAGLVFAF
jgi:hypothetical protein